MEVLALVGPSGTGKSHHAILVAQETHSDAIIDDGLLIKESRILAGTSAKRQPTRLGAIKAALFQDDAQAEEVREALRRLSPSRVLILGTSRAMIERIARRLELPEPGRYIEIEEVASPAEIARAKLKRHQHGQHVIPAPTVEVKPRLSGTIMEPLTTWLRRHQGTGLHLLVEQTLVRPSFTLLGRIYIANNVLADILLHSTRGLPGLARLAKVDVETGPEGVDIRVEIIAAYGCQLRTLAHKVQETGKKNVEEMTSLHVRSLHVLVRGLIVAPGPLEAT